MKIKNKYLVRFHISKEDQQFVRKYATNKGLLRANGYAEIFNIGLNFVKNMPKEDK